MINALQKPPAQWEPALLFALVLLIGLVASGALDTPGYTDAYYYFNAAARLVEGGGLTDPYIALTYIGAPDTLPAPSHLYWMPITSLVAAVGMGTGGPTFGAAQDAFALLWAALALIAFCCGAYLGKTRRHAWTAGLLIVFSGFFAPFWLQTDTFAPFGVAGALALIGMGIGRARADWRWFAFGGAASGVAYLTRADGLLLISVLVLVALWPGMAGRRRALFVGLLTFALVLAPWLLRNAAVGAALLPSGGVATIWLRGYDEIAGYPPDGLTLQHFLDWGVGNIIASRRVALTVNLQHFIAEQGLVILTPFILTGMWRRRRDPLLGAVGVYALLLHLAMTFAFAYPGMRGGLFHSSTALLPFWFSVGVLGIDDAVEWAAARRRHWRAAEAKLIFTVGVLAMAAALSLTAFGAKMEAATGAARYRALADRLPGDALVMYNDPAALYYHTKLPGVVTPNGDITAVRALAERYGVTHLVLDANRPAPLDALYRGGVHADFLHEIALLEGGSVRIFEVDLP